jgi:hypothetical protein
MNFVTAIPFGIMHTISLCAVRGCFLMRTVVNWRSVLCAVHPSSPPVGAAAVNLTRGAEIGDTGGIAGQISLLVTLDTGGIAGQISLLVTLEIGGAEVAAPAFAVFGAVSVFGAMCTSFPELLIDVEASTPGVPVGQLEEI